MNNLKNKILEAGIENCMFIIPMRKLNNVFGLICYTSSSDPEQSIPAIIVETRYKVHKNYKITLKGMYEGFGENHYYIDDLQSMITDGRVIMYIKQK